MNVCKHVIVTGLKLLSVGFANGKIVFSNYQLDRFHYNCIYNLHIFLSVVIMPIQCRFNLEFCCAKHRKGLQEITARDRRGPQGTSASTTPD